MHTIGTASQAGAARPSRRPHKLTSQQTIRLAVIDADSGFVTVLSKRVEAAGWQHRLLSSPAPVEELAAMKLNALLVDPALLGEQRWEFLERVCGMLPDLGVVVCTERASVAERVRGLEVSVTGTFDGAAVWLVP